MESEQLSDRKDISPLPERDYSAIEQAVLESARGRWFLAEFARRNRQADTEMLLAAIKKLEAALAADQIVAPIQALAAEHQSAENPAIAEIDVQDPNVDPITVNVDESDIHPETATLISSRASIDDMARDHAPDAPIGAGPLVLTCAETPAIPDCGHDDVRPTLGELDQHDRLALFS